MVRARYGAGDDAIPCECSAMDPRALQGGGKCGFCDLRDEERMEARHWTGRCLSDTEEDSSTLDEFAARRVLTREQARKLLADLYDATDDEERKLLKEG